MERLGKVLAKPAVVCAGLEEAPAAAEKAIALCWGVAAVAGLIAIGTVAQDGPTPATVALCAAALAPFVLDAFGIFLPRVAMSAVVIPCAIVLDGRSPHGQANAAAVLFFLVVLAGHTAAIGSVAETLITIVPIEGWLLYERAVASGPYRVGWYGWIVGCLLGAGMGFALHRGLELFLDLHRAEQELVQQSFQQERRRIAREIHDVIAHSLTVSMLHLTGARLTLEHDPSATAEAMAALAEAERAGRQSLHQVRRTVGLLAATSADDPVNEPLPGAADLEALVEDFRTAGLSVSLRWSGPRSTVSDATGLAVYRIAQESLSNAAKHAPGAPVSVEVAIGPDVRLVVRNRMTRVEPTTDGGLGIPGMVERASLLGGTVTAGPHPQGWTVEACLPNPASDQAAVAGPGPASSTAPTAGASASATA
jgi:signal transduction histidine kinase